MGLKGGTSRCPHHSLWVPRPWTSLSMWLESAFRTQVGPLPGSVCAASVSIPGQEKGSQGQLFVKDVVRAWTCRLGCM